MARMPERLDEEELADWRAGRHIRWAEQCEPDILFYRSPYKCFPLEKTGCNPS